MYQESKFNPQAESFAGALGLFQVMPRTAKELEVPLPFTPESGIYAGIRYLDWARDRFEPTLPLEERLWFTLAAYNAGFGHVNDARRLARQQGLDGDRWFGHVEHAMLMLSKRQFYTKARFGYVRGTEPVNYVRQIRNRYYAYLKL
jgi:Predicted soluble lytic transglycosylase fused to an ABC-type amino acid-binding protein